MSEKEKMNQDGTEEKAKETKPAKAEKAKAKSDKDKKPGFFKRVGRFFRELKAELKRVAWPTRADGDRHCLRHRRRHHRLDLRWHCKLRHRRSPLPFRPALTKGERVWLKKRNGMWLTPIRVMKTP